MDVHAHETDLRAAFGLEPELSDEVLAWAADPTPYLDTFFLFGPTDRPSVSSSVCERAARRGGRNHQTDSMGDSSPRPAM